MKKKLKFRITALMIAVLLFSGFPTTVLAENEYSVTEMTAQGEITSDVNVRKGPGTDYDKIGTVRAKETVVIKGKSSDGWYQIEYEGGTGFIYGDYVAVVEMPQTDETPGEVKEEGNIEEDQEEEASHSIFGVLKLIAVVVIMAVIVVMIFLTIRSLRQDEEDEDEDDDNDDYEAGEDEDAEEKETAENARAVSKSRQNQTAGRTQQEPQTIIIREEDYQLHIDPKYFEDEPIAQPDCVTGYLKKKQEQEQLKTEEENGKNKSGDIQKAMDKLQELQEELEKLKKNQ